MMDTPNRKEFMQEEIKAMEKQLKDKKEALAMAEAKGPEEQDDLSSVSSTDVLVGGQASTFDLSFLPNFLDQELSAHWKTPSLPLGGSDVWPLHEFRDTLHIHPLLPAATAFMSCGFILV